MKLPPSSVIIQNAWNLSTKHFRAFLEPVLWILVSGVVVSLAPLVPGATQATVGLLVVVQLLISLWAGVRIFDTAWTLYQGKAPSESLTRTLSWGYGGRVFDYALASLLAGLVTLLGFVLLIIPGFIFSMWFSFAALCNLLEGTSPGSASLRRSKELVVGRFWAVVWRFFVIGLSYTIPMMLVMGVIAAIIWFGKIGELPQAEIVTNVVGGVFGALLIPYISSATIVLFAELKKGR